MAKAKKQPGRYDVIIVEIFHRHYQQGIESFEFSRSEIASVASHLSIAVPKNFGDVFYKYRFRTELPKEILDTAPDGLEWLIELAGHANYRFRLSRKNRIIPNYNLIQIKIPDSTPEIIAKYALSDEQALLAKVRYNRLIDIFLAIATYSLQNHLRTTVKGIGQIEIDEIYVGVNRNGTQFVIPVQAKSGDDQLGIVQTKQDIACCQAKFPELICRPVAAQFIANNIIAMFELALEEDEIKIVDEKHYKLVPANEISRQELHNYRIREQ
ncbi:endonuclease [Iningainema tapete]|uniref:Endonuclease n=1 Tax=Iningainema tapete BLCC-T55 TaxID=2748662 RepID=A0A8J7C076_9CYAN|nr:endonuclease [Iningainema tapete]MBD2777513.1 endonuclease [Iningainema tapete BLCC-T55]